MSVPKESVDKPTAETLDPNVIQLLDVYLTEWSHRDSLLWAQISRYFYATLIVIILPNITSYLNINLPSIAPKIFPILGMILTAIFCYVSLGYAKRLEAIGNTYQNLIDTLPKQYQRVKIEEINGKIYKVHFSKFINIVLTVVLLFIAIIMLIIS